MQKYKKEGNNLPDGTNQGFCIFFLIWACRRGGAESRCIRTRNQTPPRRRAFRSNNFGLKPTTIPRDAKRQAEPPSRQGTHSHQNYFRFNPSRRLVEPRIRFAANNEHPRLNPLPRRDFPAHASRFYRAFAPAGAAQGKILSFLLVPEGHPLNNPTQATKERSGAERRHLKNFRGAGIGIQDARNLLAAKGRQWGKGVLGELSMPALCHHV